MNSPAIGRVVTFYSLKGGTGRSMALANAASILAQRNGGKRVLAVDWDVEAPGLHRYFRPYIRASGNLDRDSEIETRPGLMELVTVLRDRLAGSGRLERETLAAEQFQDLDWDRYILQTDVPGLHLMKAGRFDGTYQARIGTFDWEGLYTVRPAFFGAMADWLAERYDFVLIDSRTGFTDISGICTSLLPDTLVSVFTPNHQSLSGVVQIFKSAAKYRMNSDDLRPLRVLPLVSRVDLSELRLKDTWRFGDATEDIRGYQTEFESAFEEIYSLATCDLTAYFDEAQVQYVPFYGFGEKIAARSEESTTLSIGRSYISLADMLTSSGPAWDLALSTQNGRGQDKQPAQIPWDEEWFSKQKARSLAGLKLFGTAAAIEVRFSLSSAKPSVSRTQIAEMARDARSNGIAFPTRLPSPAHEKPQPTHDSVGGEVRTDDYYEYWALREDGDFFSLSSLLKEETAAEVVYLEHRIVQTVDVLLYCRRLYERLGISPRSKVRITIEYSGLQSYSLLSTSYDPQLRSMTESNSDDSVTSVEVVLGRIEGDLVRLVRHLLEPSIRHFKLDLEDSEYEMFIKSRVRNLQG